MKDSVSSLRLGARHGNGDELRPRSSRNDADSATAAIAIPVADE